LPFERKSHEIFQHHLPGPQGRCPDRRGYGLHSNTHIWGGAVLVGLLVVGIVSLLNYYKDAQPFNNPIARASFYMAWAACLICINSFGWASAGWLGVGGGTIILILIACSSRSTQPQAQLPSGR
jgi:hypothetical protein